MAVSHGHSVNLWPCSTAEGTRNVVLALEPDHLCASPGSMLGSRGTLGKPLGLTVTQFPCLKGRAANGAVLLGCREDSSA